MRTDGVSKLLLPAARTVYMMVGNVVDEDWVNTIQTSPTALAWIAGWKVHSSGPPSIESESAKVGLPLAGQLFALTW